MIMPQESWTRARVATEYDVLVHDSVHNVLSGQHIAHISGPSVATHTFKGDLEAIVQRLEELGGTAEYGAILASEENPDYLGDASYAEINLAVEDRDLGPEWLVTYA
jgi:hypothetical protein